MQRFIRPKLAVVTRKNGTCCSELCRFHKNHWSSGDTESPTSMSCFIFGELTINAGVARRAKRCMES